MPSPDWIVLGSEIVHPYYRFVIYASQDLSYGELSSKTVGEFDELTWMPRTRPVTEHKLSVTMKRYYEIYGDSYAECWQKLFHVWSPAEPERREISQRRREIE